MPEDIARRRRELAIVAAVLSAATLAVFFASDRNGPVDDAWISYRYARSLADGHGFAFNLGEPTQGSSTPLFVAILALARALSLDVPSVARALGLVSLFGVAWLAFASLSRRGSRALGLVAAALVLTHRDLVGAATNGMETLPYVLTAFTALELWARGRSGAAFGLSAVCVLWRLDGLAVPAALGVAHVAREREVPWRALAWPLLAGLGWLCVAWALFGDPLPSSWLAKQAHTGQRIVSLDILQRWLEGSALHLAIGAFALIFAWRARARPELDPRRFGPGILAIVLFAALHACAFALARVEIYAWYVTPLHAAAALLAAHGARELLSARLPLARAFPALALGLYLVLALTDWAGPLHMGTVQCHPDVERRRAAREGAAQIPSDAIVAAGAVGAIGWYHEGPVLDVMGLTSERMRALGAEVAPDATDGIAYYRRVLPVVLERERPPYVFVDPVIAGDPPILGERYRALVAVPYACHDARGIRRGVFTLFERR
jgi:hypothetical protein